MSDVFNAVSDAFSGAAHAVSDVVQSIGSLGAQLDN